MSMQHQPLPTQPQKLSKFFGQGADILRGQRGAYEDMENRQAIADEQLRRSQQTIDPQTQFILGLLRDLCKTSTD